MTTNRELAPDPVRHDQSPALSTRAARPTASGGAPVVTLGDVAALIGEGNQILRQRSAPAAAGRPAAGVVERARQVLARARVITAGQGTDERIQRNTEAARDLESRRERDARRGRDDVLDREQRARMDDDFVTTGNAAEMERQLRVLRAENARLATSLRRPPVPQLDSRATAAGQRQRIIAASRAATLHYMRTGETTSDAGSLYDLQRRAFKESTGADGGILLLPEQDMGPIERILAQYVTMRRIAEVRSINAYTYKKPVRISTGGARWGGELSSGGETGTPKFALLDFPAHDLYAEPIVSTNVLEDVTYDLEAEVADGCREDFALAENTTFVSGDGVEKPWGFLGYGSGAYQNFASGTPAWGKMGYSVTGVSADFAATGKGDVFVELPYKLKDLYRGNGQYMMNRFTLSKLRTLKDSTDNFLWVNGNIVQGQPGTFNGFQVIEAEQMPVIAANSFSVAFADWKSFYIIVDRVGMSVLRDPYTQSPNIVFKTRKRVGGGVKNFEAAAFVKFGTT